MGVDVLTVMDAAAAEAICRAKGVRPSTGLADSQCAAMHEARVAVAKLVNCCDATVKAFEVMGRTNGIVEHLESRRECERALVEQKAALACVAGGDA